MSTIEQAQEKIVSDFLELGDSFDQYAYLIELSCRFVPLSEKQKKDTMLVEGCQSKVWLKIIKRKDGLFEFEGDSDTLIIKGILYLLQTLFCLQDPQAVASAEISFIHRTAIAETFEDNRQKGIASIIRTLQSAAALAAQQ